jgi:hypothetical protein
MSELSDLALVYRPGYAPDLNAVEGLRSGRRRMVIVETVRQWAPDEAVSLLVRQLESPAGI